MKEKHRLKVVRYADGSHSYIIQRRYKLFLFINDWVSIEWCSGDKSDALKALARCRSGEIADTSYLYNAEDTE